MRIIYRNRNYFHSFVHCICSLRNNIQNEICLKEKRIKYIFKIFGVQYDSFQSLLIFLLLFFIIGFVVDLLSIFLINIFSQQIKNSKNKFLVRLVIDCSFSWISIHTADELIRSINISFITELVAVFLLFLLEVTMDINSKEEKNNSSLIP